MTSIAHQVQQDIADYARALRRTTNEYDPGLRAATEHFLQTLEHAPTIPAQLVIFGAQLCGLTDIKTALIAARALQMTHVAAHMNTADVQTKAAAGAGMHAAHILLANMDASENLRIKMLSITNRALLLYSQAQSYASQSAALDAYATELTLNPLHVGMVLANADCAATDAITPFALALGRYAHAKHPQDLLKAQAEQAKLTQWPVELLANIQRTIIAS
jgi:predicted component of type VI protein secretion system